MVTRSLPALELRHSPLVFVLGRVSISPVLKMADYIPEIQERLRKSGFPGYRAERTQTVEFGAGQPRFTEASRWLFQSEDETLAVVIAQDFVVLETSSYTVFDEFSRTMEAVLSVVADAAQVDFARSIGLRYVDAFRSSDVGSGIEILEPGLRGPRYEQMSEPGIDFGPTLFKSEARTNTPVGRLAVRVLQSDDGSFLPPDIVATDLSFDFSAGPDDIVTVLDFDHVTSEQIGFVPSELLELTWHLHDYTDAAFRSVITPEALLLWGAEARSS